MTESTIPDDIQNPPSKRPCLEATSAMADVADTGMDDGSDFYNTPVNAGTPLLTNKTLLADETLPGTPDRSHPQIPGLSLCNRDNEADSTSPLPNEPAGDSGEQVAETASHMESKDLTSETNGNVHIDTEMVDLEEKRTAISVPDKSQSQDITMALEQSALHDVKDEKPDTGDQGDVDENPEWEVDSSPYESSSSVSTDSSSDSSDSDDEEDGYNLLEPEEQARLLMAAEGGSDDEGDGKKSAPKEVRTTNERPEEVIPKPDVTVTPDTKVEMLGNVESIVDNVLLVKANISGEYQVLESGSVLCSADLNVIGIVSETLGRVQQPLYTVRFTNTEAIKEAGLEKGSPIFYVVDHSSFVFTQPLKGLKGSDASNLHDEEIGEEEMEFSDDEAEAEHKRQIKAKRQQKRENRADRGGGGGRGRGTALPPSGLRHSELNYDDVGEEGYTPLARPKNLHELMGAGEAPVERPQTYEQPEKSFRGGRGRGRGRGGQDRGGRGGRGRGGRDRPQGDDNRRFPREHEQISQFPSSSPTTTAHTTEHTQQHIQHTQQYPPYYQNTYQQQASAYPQPTQAYNPNPTPHRYDNVSAPYSAQSPSANQFLPQGFQFQQQPQPQQYQQYPQQQQQQPFSYLPPGAHINPAFFQALQQQTMSQMMPQQQQHQSPQQPQQAQQPQHQQHQQSPSGQGSSGDPFEAAQAHLDVLRRLSRGTSGS